MWKIVLLIPFVTALLADEVKTIAGTGQPGFTATQINDPRGLTMGPDGALYFCEAGNHIVRRLDLKTHAMSVIAGSGEMGNSGDGGPATKAELSEPVAARFDSLGNLYIVDKQNGVVRRVDVHTHNITTVAKDLKQPTCLAFTISEALLVCDGGNQRVQQVDLESGVAVTLLNQKFDGPSAITFDPGGQLYLALEGAKTIGRVNDKFVPFVTVKSPRDMSYGADYSMFVAQGEENRIVNVNMVSANVAAVLGTGVKGDGPDGDPLRCRLANPQGVLAGPDGSIYVADSGNHRIRKMSHSPEAY
jgi:hypothetical protein